MSQTTQAAKDSQIDTLIADNTTEDITPDDVRTVLKALNDKTTETGITAHAGGGQGSATALTEMYSQIDTCASDGDSVKLLTAEAGFRQIVFNNTSNNVSIFPQSGEYINGTLNAEIQIAAGQTTIFECVSTGKWIATNLVVTTSALTGNGTAANPLDYNGAITPTVSGGIVQKFAFKVSLTAAQIKTANSVPIDVGLPASGAGYYYRVTAFDMKINYGTIQFTSEVLAIRPTASIEDYQFLNQNLQVDGNSFIAGAQAGISTIGSGSPKNIVENDTLSISADADSAVGDSTIDCYITVEKVKL